MQVFGLVSYTSYLSAIRIILYNKSGGVWFSSNWNGTTTIEQTVSGGNLVVH